MLNEFMNNAVVDSNVLIAIIDSRDKWHEKASALVDALQSRNIGLVWFDSVINETVSVLARRTEEQKRSDQLSTLLDALVQMMPPERITWISSETRRLYSEVLEQIMASDGALNFHDALIALCCREYGIEMIASFDRDFDLISWLNRIEKPLDVFASHSG